MPTLRVLPSEALIPDPDVQIADTLEDKRVMAMTKSWNPDYATPLVVVPLDGANKGKYGIIDGRHRFLAGVASGVKEWRCDVHLQPLTVAEKARLKLAIDRDRRRVGALEHFQERLKMNDPDALKIAKIAGECGYEIGRTRSGKPYTRIEAIAGLESAYLILCLYHGPDGLRRLLSLNREGWYDEPKTNNGNWIRALGLFVRDGYDQHLSPTATERLSEQIPAKLLRIAEGEVVAAGSQLPSRGTNTGTQASWGTVAFALASLMRRKAGLKRRPVSPFKDKAQRGKAARPLD